MAYWYYPWAGTTSLVDCIWWSYEWRAQKKRIHASEAFNRFWSV